MGVLYLSPIVNQYTAKMTSIKNQLLSQTVYFVDVVHWKKIGDPFCWLKKNKCVLEPAHCVGRWTNGEGSAICQGRDWMMMIFSLMQNRCRTLSRFSPQRDTWRSMAKRKSSLTPFVIPRVTVWCLINMP